MTMGKTNLNNLEKQVKIETEDNKIRTAIVDWDLDNGQSIEDRVKARALEINDKVIFIYWGKNEEIERYTYDPKLKRGWHD